MKNQFIRTSTILVAALTISQAVLAQQKPTEPKTAAEEIIISAAHIQNRSTIVDPVHLISKEQLATDATQTLGESINSLLGLASASYGDAIGQPIIRGLSSSRVRILQNGIIVRDVATQSFDHPNDVSLHDAQQIEIVRGPSSLLYANGSLGGIINIVDNSIPQKALEQTDMGVGLESQTVNEGTVATLAVSGAISDNVNLTYSLADTSFGNFDIPGGHLMHEEEYLSSITNSDSERTSHKFGGSYTGDWGFIGGSFTTSEGTYGIPFHGEHHEEEEEEEHEEERVFASTESSAFDIDGLYRFESGYIHSAEYFVRSSSYELAETEDEAIANIFKNEAVEFGIKLDISGNSTPQKLVLNSFTEEVTVRGGLDSPASVSEVSELTLGYYLSKEFATFSLDFGVRHDLNSRVGTFNTATYDISNDRTSFAVTLSKELSDSLQLALGLSNVYRAPSAIESFIHSGHLATGRYEIGDPTLVPEKANNLDLRLEYERDNFFVDLTFFNNDIDDFIYLQDDAMAQTIDELLIARYTQANVSFTGHEFEVGYNFDLAAGDLAISVGTDSVTGELTSGGYLPRITPDRFIVNVDYSRADFQASVTLKEVAEQDQVATTETTTAGYTLLEASVSQKFKVGGNSVLTVSVFGKNLLDEFAQNHTSAVKDEVPLPGTNLGVKVGLDF